MEITELEHTVRILNESFLHSQFVLEKRRSPLRYYFRTYFVFLLPFLCASILLSLYLLQSKTSPSVRPIQIIIKPIEKTSQQVYRNPIAKYGLLHSTEIESIHNLYDFIYYIADLHQNGICMVQSESSKAKSWTYREILDRINNIIRGIYEIDIKENSENNEQPMIGLCGKTSIEWFIVLIALYGMGYKVVLLSSTYSLSTITQILMHTKVETVFCNTINDAQRLSKAHANLQDWKKLKQVVLLQSESPESMENEGIIYYTLADIEAKGKTSSTPLSLCRPSVHDKEIAIVSFEPSENGLKGVDVSHNNFLSALSALSKDWVEFYMKDLYLSYASSTVLIEHLMIFTILKKGGKVQFVESDTPLKAMQVVQPTILLSSVSLYKQWLNKISKFPPGLLRFLTYSINLQSQKLPGWNYVFLYPLRRRLGLSSCRYIFFHPSFQLAKAMKTHPSYPLLSCLLDSFTKKIRIYGSNETCGIYALSLLPSITCQPNECGNPIASNEIYFKDAQIYGYSKIPDTIDTGIVCVRGYNVSNMSYQIAFDNDEKDMEESKKSEYTGTRDIGYYDRTSGKFSIIDNIDNFLGIRKDMFVSLTKIETCIETSNYVESAIVYTSVNANFLIAAIYPNIKAFNKEITITDIQKEGEYQKIILFDVLKLSQKHNLNGFETVRKIFIVENPLKEWDEVIHPKCKNERNYNKVKYAHELGEEAGAEVTTTEGRESEELSQTLIEAERESMKVKQDVVEQEHEKNQRMYDVQPEQEEEGSSRAEVPSTEDEEPSRGMYEKQPEQEEERSMHEKATTTEDEEPNQGMYEKQPEQEEERAPPEEGMTTEDRESEEISNEKDRDSMKVKKSQSDEKIQGMHEEEPEDELRAAETIEQQ